MIDRITRRDFLKYAGTVTGSALLAACAPKIAQDVILGRNKDINAPHIVPATDQKPNVDELAEQRETTRKQNEALLLELNNEKFNDISNDCELAVGFNRDVIGVNGETIKNQLDVYKAGTDEFEYIGCINVPNIDFLHASQPSDSSISLSKKARSCMKLGPDNIVSIGGNTIKINFSKGLPKTFEINGNNCSISQGH